MKIALIIIGIIALIVISAIVLWKSHNAEVEYESVITARQYLREKYKECRGCPYLQAISVEHQKCEVEARLCPRAKQEGENYIKPKEV